MARIQVANVARRLGMTWSGCTAPQVQQALARMQHHQLSYTFEGWKAHAEEAKAMRLQLDRAVRMWTGRFMSRAFKGWSEHAAMKHAARQLCAGIWLFLT